MYEDEVPCFVMDVEALDNIADVEDVQCMDVRQMKYEWDKYIIRSFEKRLATCLHADSSPFHKDTKKDVKRIKTAIEHAMATMPKCDRDMVIIHLSLVCHKSKA